MLTLKVQTKQDTWKHLLVINRTGLLRFGGLSMLHKHSKCSFLNWSGLILTRKPHKCTLNMILVPQLKKDALWSSGRASTGMFMGIYRMYLTVWQQLLGLNLSLQLSDRCRQIKWQFRMEMQLIIRPSRPWLFPRTAAVSRPVRAGVDWYSTAQTLTLDNEENRDWWVICM